MKAGSGKTRARLRTLEIKGRENDDCSYRRAFLRDDQVPAERDPQILDETSNLIVAASPIGLAPEYCEGLEDGVTLLVPEPATRAAELLVAVEYDSGVKGLTKRRYRFKAGDSADGVTFRLFAFDPVQNWVGAVLGKVQRPKR
ncbi:MAG TPA: hypothetical protein DEH78_02220 [Solibacterales bacterium]|nr:hypothetical protein [Bryobacterales bacterium]